MIPIANELEVCLSPKVHDCKIKCYCNRVPVRLKTNGLITMSSDANNSDSASEITNDVIEQL